MLTVIVSIFVLLVTSRVLGAESRGVISMIVVGITIIVLVNEVFGGPSLVYFIPRNPLKRLLLPAYAWAVAACAMLSLGLYAAGLIPGGFALHTFLLALLQCIGSIHLIVLLGREKIRSYNYIYLAQSLALAAALAIFVFGFAERSVSSWVWSTYCSYGILFLLSTIAVIPELKTDPVIDRSSYRHIIRNGFYAQLASLSHLLTNRISYYFLNSKLGSAAVGIYSTGASVCESLLLISSSVSTVIYTRISNAYDKQYSQQITLRLAKLCLVISVPGLIILSLLPPRFYITVFGAEFHSIGKLVLLLAPGILALSYSSIIVNYFSGTGKVYVNTISAIISLCITTILAYMLVPLHHLAGAAIAVSAAHCASAIFLSAMFIRESNFTVLHLLPGRKDYREVKRDIKKLVQIKR